MSVLEKLAYSLGRKDENPNQELARQIVKDNDSDAIKELVGLLHHKKKDIRYDSIKVLYEAGAINPSLIAANTNDFSALLDGKDNRLQWGGMTALSEIVRFDPKGIYAILGQIVAAADKGSVITRDRCVLILISLASLKQYSDQVFPLLKEQLMSCPTNQLPMYAEQALPAINEKNRTAFIGVLQSRLDEVEKESKRKRIEKIIKKLS